jgi:hypothetical protein
MTAKKITFFIVILLLSQFLCLTCIYVKGDEGSSSVVYVDDDYSSSTPGWRVDHFESIQEGVDAVSDGGVVYVSAGVYFENIVIDKSLDLVGNDKSDTVIDGGELASVINITVGSVDISGFTIRNSSVFFGDDYSYDYREDMCGIIISSGTLLNNISNVCIFENKFVDNQYNIKIEMESFSNHVSNVQIYDNEIIVEDIFEDTYGEVGGGVICDGNGVFIEDVDNIYDFEIYDNTVTIFGSNCSAISVGGRKHTIQNNQITQTSANKGRIYGVIGDFYDCLIHDNNMVFESEESTALQISSSDNIISNNTVTSSGGVLYYSVEPSGVNIIRDNVFTSNGENVSIYCQYGSGNETKEYFYHNNFFNLGSIELVNNYWSADDYYNSQWYQGYPSGGNYWDDYTVYDYYHGVSQDKPCSDGIGDEPYEIDVVGALDSYPLMNPSYSSKKHLVLDVDSPVLEQQSFDVTVTSDGKPVEDAIVSFADNEYQTDSSGVASIVAPLVSSNQSFNINSSKTGYFSSDGSILVVDDSSYDGSLKIVCSSILNESENYNVYVKTMEDNPVDNALVEFNNENYYTDSSGRVLLTMPYVSSDTNYDISADKNKYLPAEKTITVKNTVLTSVNIISPVGDETWSGSNPVFWSVSNPPEKNYVASLEYRNSKKPWTEIAEKIEENYYFWDTTDVSDDDQYQIRVSIKVDENNYGFFETSICSDVVDDYFSIKNNLKNTGWLYGYVYTQENGSTVALNDTQISVVLSEEEGSITSKCAFSDENGDYKLFLPVGSYTVKISKKGYELKTKENIQISKNDGTLLHIVLNESSTGEYLLVTNIDEYRKEIKNGIINQRIGGEITIKKMEEISDFEKLIYIYDGISISDLNIGEDSVSLSVDGDENLSGRTLVINLEEDFFETDENLSIFYDGKKIGLADDISDILNPNDDGSNPEYLVTYGSNGTQVLVSIPHFSVHTISISNVGSQFAAKDVVDEIQQNKEIVTVIAVLIIIIAVFFMLRKGKEEDF